MARLLRVPPLPRAAPIARLRTVARAVTAVASAASVSAFAACGGGPGAVDGGVVTLLETVTVVAERITVLGYERERFGGWGASGPCDTRHAVLVDWFGGAGCDADGVIDDPYTGAELEPVGADVDHVYPLAAAWDFGAHSWDARRRREFANDAALNLVPVASDVNREKSDLTPADWLPPPRDLRCDYSARYLRVAVAWRLPVSVADWEAMADACGVRARVR
ncbi:HNH endonuclease family protein [uncultured Corynebacterium sp.]|uniref:HNH endonuclease family protein n=1 Tax=uncultured Corynebacterium sp. TaxID=159447 RepID=UPI0025EA6CA8|nr:HNH endonuclease family protein [uncultured Corynebacterium sp.]